MDLETCLLTYLMWIGFLRSMSAGISLLILITASIMDRCKSYEIIKTDNNKLLIKDSDKFASHHQKNKKANISLLVGDGIFGTLALTLALSLIIDACVSIGLCINARNDQKEFLNSNWITDIICKSLGLTGEVVWLIADGTTHLLQHRLHTQQIIPFLGNDDIIEAINSNPQQAENRYSAFAHPNVQAATANQPIEDEQANGIIQDVSKTDDKKDQPSFN
ncbi:MAG: hypothetical protein K0S11_1653 [Gammaproteobacteria bacterium]|nr:hypothetical protein [Gammaproteobacteria bacterium]